MLLKNAVQFADPNVPVADGSPFTKYGVAVFNVLLPFTIIDLAVFVSATLTVKLAVLDPSIVVTVMIVVPSANGVTTPFTTVATVGALDVQVTFLLVAFAGEIVAVKVLVPVPTLRFKLVGFRLTPVTGIVAGVADASPQAFILFPSTATLMTCTKIGVPFVPTISVFALYSTQSIKGTESSDVCYRSMLIVEFKPSFFSKRA